jgi:hypothetical protein
VQIFDAAAMSPAGSYNVFIIADRPFSTERRGSHERRNAGDRDSNRVLNRVPPGTPTRV